MWPPTGQGHGLLSAGSRPVGELFLLLVETSLKGLQQCCVLEVAPATWAKGFPLVWTPLGTLRWLPRQPGFLCSPGGGASQPHLLGEETEARLPGFRALL